MGLEQLVDPQDDRLIVARPIVVARIEQLVTAPRGDSRSVLAVFHHVVIGAGPELPLGRTTGWLSLTLVIRPEALPPQDSTGRQHCA